MKKPTSLMMALGLAAIMPNAFAGSEHVATKTQLNITSTDSVIKSVNPRYPKKAVRESIEGWVKLAVDVNKQGNVSKVKVVDAQPRRIFEDEAVKSMKQWQFKPKNIDGKLVPYQVSQTIKFELKNFNMDTGQYEQ